MYHLCSQMDGIAVLATTANVEVTRINALEKENAGLKKCKPISHFYIQNVIVPVEYTGGLSQILN